MTLWCNGCIRGFDPLGPLGSIPGRVVMKDVVIIAGQSPYEKCRRCRNAIETCSFSSYWVDVLCRRCVKVLCQLEEAGLWHPGQQHEWTAETIKMFEARIKKIRIITRMRKKKKKKKFFKK